MTKEKLLSDITNKPIPKHIALILDGNGRWATRRGLPRNYGHQKGVKTLKEIVSKSQALGVKNITVYAFSTENWKRDQNEVDYLMNIFKKFYRDNKNKFVKEKVKVQIIGERKGLDAEMLKTIEEIENATKDFHDFVFSVAFNYGSTFEILNMVKYIANQVKFGLMDLQKITVDTMYNNLYTKNLYPVDLIIRTSGEVRLSNFLLLQAAYSELYFTNTLWPDFHAKELYIAISEYQKRNRRFGKVG